jgi:hypothetical protein
VSASALGQDTDDKEKTVTAIASLEPASISAGGQGRLKITLHMAGDLHVNANVTVDPNLIATSFTPAEVPGITWEKPEYPDPSKVTEWYSDEPLVVFQNGAVIVVPFKVGKDAPVGELSLPGVLRAQACDHEQCYPPKRIQIKAQLIVTSGK